VASWGDLRLRPRTLVGVSEVSTELHLAGHELAAPIVLAPTGRQRLLHPDGEFASARAAGQCGIPYCLASFATADLHEVAVEDGEKWLQIYVAVDRGYTRSVIEAARLAGYTRIVLTVDRLAIGDRPRMREPIDLLEGVTVASHLGTCTDVEMGRRVVDVSLCFDDLEGLACQGLPLSVKGILRGDDARRALDHGADSVIVSNHGGRHLSGAVATARALPEVVEAVPYGTPVLVDGGIRCGSDIVRALALGASAVLIGRPYLWGLAAHGMEGVAAAVRALIDDLREVMQLCGLRRLEEIGPDLVVEECE
jgi:4-hydroxymandelate oxidase